MKKIVINGNTIFVDGFVKETLKFAASFTEYRYVFHLVN